MTHAQGSRIRSILSSIFSAKWIEDTSREVGFIQRARKLDPVAFFWTLVFGFGVGNARNFAALRRTYEAETGDTLVPSAFYDRFTERLAVFLREALTHLIETAAEPARPLRGRLSAFADVVAIDSTVLKLNDLLDGVYAGTRTNTAKAAAKLNLAMSVLGRGPHTVRVTGERVGETKMLRIGPWVAGRLLMFDLGYFCYQAFARIHQNGGFFISRLKASANPTLVSLLRKVRGNSLEIEGRKLRELLPKLKRGVLDAEALVSFKRRAYRGRRRTDESLYRLVAVLNQESGEYHVYITNVPVEKLSAEDVARVYAARWEIELIFRQLKSQFRLSEFPTSRKAAVEALIYASLITLAVSRTFLMELRRLHPDLADRMPAERWSAIFAEFAVPMLHCILEGRRRVHCKNPDLLELMRKEAIDPNLARLGGLLGRVETGSDDRYGDISHA